MTKKMENKTMSEKEALKRCLCGKCPSHSECGEGGGHCLSMISGSICVTEDRGCKCKKCSVHKENNFRFDLYCMKGSEEQQSEM
ncbi:MAG: DUF2769 domain-containing protein [bacterium]